MKTLLYSSINSLAAVLLLWCFGNIGLAEQPTFAKLQAMCRDSKNPLQYGYCVGFVEAIALRIVHENKNCTFLDNYLHHADANLALPDLIGVSILRISQRRVQSGGKILLQTEGDLEARLSVVVAAVRLHGK